VSVPVVATTRRAVLWVPDWPVVAAMTQAGLSAERPAAVLHGRGVVAVSAAARAAGVRRGQRRRLAQQACPDIAILPYDQARDARSFEAVAVAAEQVVSGVEISRPGLLMIPAEGAARFHGSEEALAGALVSAVADDAGCESSVGMADGFLAAILAARTSSLIPPGESADYLATMPVTVLAHAAMERAQRAQVEDLVSVLIRLGIDTLAALTHLPVGDVLARFGAVGVWAQRLARGEDVTAPVLRRSEDDIAVEYAFDEPVHRSEHLIPVVRLLAEQLDQALLAAGMRCGKVAITARTQRGDTLERVWRTDVGVRSGAFATHMADRVRWQVEGWLNGTAAGPERSALVWLGVLACDVVPLGSEHSYLWGGISGADSRAQRTVDRIQGLIGPEGVLAVREQGGRSPRERVLASPWGQELTEQRRLAHPWPGRIPDPPPATVLVAPAQAQVLDAGGAPVVIDRRLGLSAPPTWVRLEADRADQQALAAHRHPASGHVGRVTGTVWDRPRPVEAWAGPWPIAQRWWSEQSSRHAYLQVTLRDGPAVLLAFTGGCWMLDGVYD